MKAARIHRYGADAVQIDADVPTPQVQPNTVLVRVHAAGVNPFDWKLRAGYMAQAIPLTFPTTLGGDFSGVITAVGTGVTGFSVGDEVYGQAHILTGGTGSFAEIARASTATIARKPKNLTHGEAASLPLVGASAWQALVDHMHLLPKQKILIHGGAGGIGTIALRIAKYIGAYVATTATGSDIAYVKELGADEIVDYKAKKFEDVLPHDLDAVFDTVAGETYTRSFPMLKNGGVIVSMLEKPNQELMEKYGVHAIAQSTEITAERLQKIAELANQGILKIHIDRTFPLEEAREALSYLESGRVHGKVVIEVR